MFFWIDLKYCAGTIAPEEIAPRLGLGFGLGLALELRLGGQFSFGELS